MKGAILINAYKVYDSVWNQVERLKEEFHAYQIEIDVISNAEITAFIANQNIETTLRPYDFIINLDKDIYIARMIEKAGIPLFNSSYGLEICDDKMLTYIALANLSIPMPKTISAPLCYKEEKENHFIENVEKMLSYPLVAKECYGSLGQQVYLIENHEELLKIEKKLLYKPHLYQEYIDSSKGKDVRVVVVGNHVVAWMERYSLDDFRSNLAQGGHARPVEISPKFIELAEKISKELHLDYCGIDFLYGKNGEPILCEVNSNAFFKGIENISHVNVAKCLVEHILKKLTVDKK